MAFSDIVAAGAFMVAILMSLIQISPIKIDPWTTIGNWLNKNLLKRLDDIDVRVIRLDKRVSEQAAINARARILRFGDEILMGEKHSKEHFDSILRETAVYERYCEENSGFENGVTELTIERIKDVYKERLEKGDFLS